MIVNNRQVEELQAIYSTNSKIQAIKSEYGDVVVKKIAGGYELRPKPVRAKNPAPRVGTKRPRRVSQVTKKPPTKRLVTRRKANTKAGYFPNPITYSVYANYERKKVYICNCDDLSYANAIALLLNREAGTKDRFYVVKTGD